MRSSKFYKHQTFFFNTDKDASVSLGVNPSSIILSSLEDHRKKHQGFNFVAIPQTLICLKNTLIGLTYEKSFFF